MKKFIKNSIAFLLPILLIFIFIELYVTVSPNTFNIKAKHIKQNPDIEILILGTSHTQNAVNPEQLSKKASNLAYGGQDYSLDSAIFFRYINSLDKLKYVFVEVNYHSIDNKTSKDYHSLPWYYRYHGVNVYNLNPINIASFYFSSPAFFNQYIKDKLKVNKYNYLINEFGFVTNDFPGIFYDSKYNYDKLYKNSKKRFTKIKANSKGEYYLNNIKKINTVIDFCIKNGINVILLKTPYFITFRQHYEKEQLFRRDNFIDSIISNNPKIKLFDFEQDNNFIITDFKDDNHLNPSGARKLTKKIDSLLYNMNYN